MSVVPPTTWHEVNQRYLSAALASLRDRLERAAAAGNGPACHGETVRTAPESETLSPAIETLSRAFGLSAFERELLLLCAGVELDAGLAAACEALLGQPGRHQPTFGLALALLPEAHWSALTPAAPLRWWRLIEIMDGSSLTRAPLRIDERVLHYLTGIHYLDERLAGSVERLARGGGLLAASHREVAERIV